MPSAFFAHYQNVSYPCYLLDNENQIHLNESAREADAPLSDPQAIERLLREARQEMHLCDTGTPKMLPLMTDALRMRTLTLLPVAVGLFAAAVEERAGPVNAFSRQMREPLTNIFSILPLMASRMEDSELVYAERIQANSYELLRLATNLENASRLEKKKYVLQPVDAAALVDAVCTSVNSVCRGWGVPIRWEAPPAPLPVRADPRLLSDGLLNLLRNSLEYTRDDNAVFVKLARAGKFVALTVHDKGLGIKPEFIEHIFEPFFSVDPYGDSTLRPGLGLGLSVLRETVCGFGGMVSAESRFGEGTSIHASLPLALVGEADTLLESASADYLTNRYSSVYVQMSGLCRLPSL